MGDDMKAVRVAVIGAGVMGAFHARSLSECHSAELVAIADVRPGTAEECASQFDCLALEDVDRIFSREFVDGVIIATPVDTHVDLVERAAVAGLGVLCEKPLARTLDDCRRAIAVTAEYGVPLQVGFHRRFDPDWRVVRRSIEDDEVGEILVIKSTLRDLNPPPIEYLRTSGGYFMDAFVHDMDAARWLGGEIESVTAVGGAVTDTFISLGDYDTAAIVLNFASGSLGIIDGTRMSTFGYECTTEVVGSRSTVRVRNRSLSNVTLLSGGSERTPQPSSFLERFAVAYKTEIAAFVAMLASGTAPVINGYDALVAQALSEAAALSAHRRTTVHLEEILPFSDLELAVSSHDTAYPGTLVELPERFDLRQQ